MLFGLWDMWVCLYFACAGYTLGVLEPAVILTDQLHLEARAHPVEG